MWQFINRLNFDKCSKMTTTSVRAFYFFVCCILGLFIAIKAASAQMTLPMSSSSMEPTIYRGEQVYIDLFTSPPLKVERGDVIVYRSPKDGTSYAHRVVGTPGDIIFYDHTKKLSVNGAVIDLAPYFLPNKPNNPGSKTFVETFDGKPHLIQLRDQNTMQFEAGLKLSTLEQCRVTSQSFQCHLPPLSYFVMGDNRDNSFDSRYVGFIPEAAISGIVKRLHEPPEREGVEFKK